MSNTTTKYDVIILGAGASGLYCAMHAAARGRKVLVLDHSGKAGRKIRVAGGGKCNFTNRKLSSENYLGEDLFIQKVFDTFDNVDLILYFTLMPDGKRMIGSIRDVTEAKVLEDEKFKITCDLGIADGTFTAYGCDLGYEYVKINADYRT